MNKTLLRKTWRDLRAARAQSIALIFIAALGVASFIGLVSSFRDLDTSYNHTYEQLRFADVTFRVDSMPEKVAAEVLALDGVTAVNGRLVVDTGFELTEDEQIRARLIGLPATAQPDVNQLYVEDGSYLQAEDGRQALVDAHFAKFYDLKPGDMVTPIINGENIEMRVTGIATSPEYLIVSPSQQDILPSARTFAILFVPLAELQTLTGNEGKINEVAVLLKDGADTAVIPAIQALLQPYQLQATTLQKDVPSNAALQLDLAGYEEISALMPTLILLVAAISVYVMLGRMVKAQQPQIGLMKALGYSHRTVLAHYLTFALAIGGLGTVIGVLLGFPLANAITGTYAAELGIPLVQSTIYPDLIAQSGVLSLVLFVLAGIGPARGSAKLAPAEAMRLDPAVALVNGRKSLLERFIRLPLRWRLPLRNVFRMRRRSFTTGLGVVFSFILVLMVWGMWDSMNYYIIRNFEEVERWDLIAVFDQPQTAATLAIAKGWEGVEAVSPAMQLPATITVNGDKKDLLLTALTADQEMHVLQLPDGVAAEEVMADGRIVLTESMADSLNIAIGDEIEVNTPFGKEQYTFSNTTDELMGIAAYIGYETAQDLVPLPTEIFNGIYLTVDPAHAKTIKADLYRLPGAASVQLKSDIRQDWQELMGLFYTFMGVMLVFALAMAFALLFNAMTVNVLERQRELATMRSIGAGSRNIARQIMMENLILWVVTLVPGLLIGTWTAVEMGKALSAELFTLKINISPLSYGLTAVGILLTMLLAAWPAIRRVNRLNLADATKVLT